MLQVAIPVQHLKIAQLACAVLARGGLPPAWRLCRQPACRSLGPASLADGHKWEGSGPFGAAQNCCMQLWQPFSPHMHCEVGRSWSVHRVDLYQTASIKGSHSESLGEGVKARDARQTQFSHRKSNTFCSFAETIFGHIRSRGEVVLSESAYASTS